MIVSFGIRVGRLFVASEDALPLEWRSQPRGSGS